MPWPRIPDHFNYNDDEPNDDRWNDLRYEIQKDEQDEQ